MTVILATSLSKSNSSFGSIKGQGELSRDEKVLLYMREVLGELHFLADAGETA